MASVGTVLQTVKMANLYSLGVICIILLIDCGTFISSEPCKRYYCEYPCSMVSIFLNLHVLDIENSGISFADVPEGRNKQQMRTALDSSAVCPCELLLEMYHLSSDSLKSFSSQHFDDSGRHCDVIRDNVQNETSYVDDIESDSEETFSFAIPDESKDYLSNADIGIIIVCILAVAIIVWFLFMIGVYLRVQMKSKCGMDDSQDLIAYEAFPIKSKSAQDVTELCQKYVQRCGSGFVI